MGKFPPPCPNCRKILETLFQLHPTAGKRFFDAFLYFLRKLLLKSFSFWGRGCLSFSQTAKAGVMGSMIGFGVFVFVLGLVVGSFLNSVIFRLRHRKTILGYSFCPHCKRQLRPLDLIPLVSFFWLGRKCRYCDKPISWQYPAVELATAVIFTLFAKRVFSFSESLVDPKSALITLIFELIFASLLIIIFVFDLKYYLIPDRIVAAGIVFALAFRLLTPGLSIVEGLGGGLVLSGFFGGLYLLSQGRWLGLGDVKLGLFLGLLLGFSFSLLMLFFAYISGALVGISLVLAGRKTLKGVLPFGTFLVAATIVVMLWGREILQWYLPGYYL